MFTVTKVFSFEAAHSLPHLPKGHKCRNLHGHSYKVVVHCATEELDKRGFVVDYAEISAAMASIVRRLDHRNLNDILEQSTAEILAVWIYKQLFLDWALPVVAVEVRETEKTSVIYRP